MSQAMPTAVAVHYPYSAGRPMADSEHQLVPMLYLLTVLRNHFADRPDVYVGGDMFVYYAQGDPLPAARGGAPGAVDVPIRPFRRYRFRPLARRRRHQCCKFPTRWRFPREDDERALSAGNSPLH